MNIDDVKKVARLARIELTDEECRVLGEQFESILTHIKKIDELDLEGVEPVSHPFNIKNVFREDVIREQPGFTEAFMKIAPESEKQMVKVPRVIEGKE